MNWVLARSTKRAPTLLVINMKSIIPQPAVGNIAKAGRQHFLGFNMMQIMKVHSASSAGCMGSPLNELEVYGLLNHSPIGRRLWKK